jgi:hypothetical protein
MKKISKLFFGCCLLGAATGTAFGEGRMFLVPFGGNPGAHVHGTDEVVIVQPGDLLVVEVYLQDPAGVDAAQALSTYMPCSATFSDGGCGASGDATFVGDLIPGATCANGPNDGDPCAADSTCKVCVGGLLNGLACASDAGCPGGDCPDTAYCHDDLSPNADAGHPAYIAPPAAGWLPGFAGFTCPSAPDGSDAPRIAIAGTSNPQSIASAKYVGEYKYQVPPGAKGEATLNLVILPGTTSWAKADLVSIPITDATSDGLVLTVQCGQCCDGVNCLGDVVESECLPPATWDPAKSCALGDPCICVTNADCNDNNACTNNVCGPGGQCTFPSNVPAGQCCDPADGVLLPINDNNECTVDSCDTSTGIVTNDGAAAEGNAFTDDGNPCTLDRCESGACAHDDITAIACASDAECQMASGGASQTCGQLAPGFCDCVANPPLTLECPNDDVCYDAGEKIVVNVVLGGGTLTINGGQFRILYDPACMDFLSIAPGSTCDPGSPYEVEIFEQVNEVSGEIFYAVGISLVQNGGTNDGGVLACLSFAKQPGCNAEACEVCFDDLNPQHTYLSGPAGDMVLPDQPNGGCSSCNIRTAGETTLTVPEGGSFNADCDSPTAIVTWANSASASNTCEGALDLTCTCSHTNPLVTNCGSLIAHGGEFPQGTATFECCATDDCGVETCGTWTVFVSDETTLDLVLQLSPTMDSDQFTRCIEFGFYANCVEAPEIFKEELVFGPPYDFPGHATYDIKVPKGQYACITARDQAHTLRSVADIECAANGHLSAEFKGDPFFGGNWLIGGNLDGSHVIDILDFGVLVSQYLKPGDASNTCEQIKEDGYRDADVNADGIVDSLDYAFIQGNFLEEDKDSCCPDSDPGAGEGPVFTSITVQELRAMGLGDLAVADLNRDGVLNAADMEAFQAGVVPTPEHNRNPKKVSR